MSAGSPICRASVSASRASGTPWTRRRRADDRPRRCRAEGGVGEVAAGSRQPAARSFEAGGVGERAGSNRDVYSGVEVDFLDPPVVGIAAFVRLGGAAAQFLGDGHIPAMGREHGADRQGERVARVLAAPGSSRAGSPSSSRGYLFQIPLGAKPARIENAVSRLRVSITQDQQPAGFLFGAEPHRPKHLLAPVVMPDLLEDARVVVGVSGLPPVGFAGLG